MRARGVFAGISLEGARVAPDEGRPPLPSPATPAEAEILFGATQPAPRSLPPRRGSSTFCPQGTTSPRSRRRPLAPGVPGGLRQLRSSSPAWTRTEPGETAACVPNRVGAVVPRPSASASSCPGRRHAEPPGPPSAPMSATGRISTPASAASGAPQSPFSCRWNPWRPGVQTLQARHDPRRRHRIEPDLAFAVFPASCATSRRQIGIVAPVRKTQDRRAAASVAGRRQEITEP